MEKWNSKQFRFLNRGMNWNRPIDGLPEDQYVYLRNIRSYNEGRMESRPGLDLWKTFSAIPGSVTAGPVKSCFTLIDSSPDIGGAPGLRFAVAGQDMFFADLGAVPVYQPCDLGYSGNPVSFVSCSGLDAPDPWLYTYDSAKQVRYSPGRVQTAVGGAFPVGRPLPFTIGITAPNDAFQDLGLFTKAAGDLTGTYYYRYQLRDPYTGTRSVPSPPTGYPTPSDCTYGRIDLTSQKVTLTLPIKTLVDGKNYLCDIYRWSTTNTNWRLVDTQLANGGAFEDNIPDVDLENAAILDEGYYQPWVTGDVYHEFLTDLPENKLVKTSIGDGGEHGHGGYIIYEWQTLANSPGPAGSYPNQNWIYGTELTLTGGIEFTAHLRRWVYFGCYQIVDGVYYWRATMEVIEMLDDVDPVTALVVTGALEWNYPLGKVFGPFGAGYTGLYFFACGDSRRPGTLYWTNGNDPDSTNLSNYIEVTDASDPLQNGCIYNGRAYVWSKEKMWEITPDLVTANKFVVQVLPGSRGLYAPWCFAVGDYMYWRGKDGIYMSNGGQPVSITDQDLYPFFPHDGQSSYSIQFPNGDFGDPGEPQFITIQAVSDADADLVYQRLAWGDGNLYFDYKNAGGEYYTLVYLKLPGKQGGQSPQAVHGWSFDTFNQNATILHYYEPVLHSLLVAYGLNLYQMTGVDDDGEGIKCQVETGAMALEDSRAMKLIGDGYVGANSNAVSIRFRFLGKNNVRFLGTTTFSSSPYQQKRLNINSGNGLLDRTIGLWASWAGNAATVELYDWQPSWILKPVTIETRTTDWDNDGNYDNKYVKGCAIKADVDPFDPVNSSGYEGISLTGADLATDLVNATHVTSASVHGTGLFVAGDINGVIKITGGVNWITGIYYITNVVGGVAYLDRAPAPLNTGAGEWAMGGNRTVNVYGDDGSFRQIYLSHPGQTILPYSWPPFISYQMRLLPVDAYTVRIWDDPGIKWHYDKYADYSGEVGPITNLGYIGAKFVQGVRITADSKGTEVAYRIQWDYNPPTLLDQSIDLPAKIWTGKQTIPFSFTPFIAHQLQIIPLGRVSTFYDECEFIWEPVPELARNWQTQATDHDIAGFHFLRDAWIAYASHPDADPDTDFETLKITTEYGVESYQLPCYVGTLPAFTRFYLPLKPQKAKWRHYQIESTLGCRVFVKDTVVRVQEWGGKDFKWAQPFGDLSRAAGARI